MREQGRAMGAEHLLLIVADGVRPDVLREEIDAGRTPALAALAARGGVHAVSASFPSVTGAAYVPFLMGRNPAEVGLPGLRWFDRSRSLRRANGSARSYVGVDIWQVDHDVDAHAPTLLELARPSLSAMSMLARGASLGNVGRSIAWMLRAAVPHLRGDILGWRRVELAATRQFFARFARLRPRFSVLAITSPDKFAHAFGARSDAVRTSILDIDRAVAEAERIAAAGGWGALRVWVVGDHGHAPVSKHDDLHGWLESRGHRVVAHPKLRVRRADIALMVGGNAMAHLYVDPSTRARGWWPAHHGRWGALHDALAERESIDLVAVAADATTTRVVHGIRGGAEIQRRETSAGARWDYIADGGDPLGLGGTLRGLDKCTAWQACAGSDYPDAIVQLASLALSARSGDLILSARDGWDLRERYERVPHVSTHGALLRDQMMVPLLVDVPTTHQPLRTTDVVPSALRLLGIESEARFDGRSFL